MVTNVGQEIIGGGYFLGAGFVQKSLEYFQKIEIEKKNLKNFEGQQ